MKNLITQKQLLDDGYQVFRYAGEYLFVGSAKIYIDRGDDDIILFHDGEKYIRFIVAQRDLTFFYKGELDMLRIGDNTEFDIKVISERFSVKDDMLLDMLQLILNKSEQIRYENELCCRKTNLNLDKLINNDSNSLDTKVILKQTGEFLLGEQNFASYEVSNAAVLESVYSSSSLVYELSYENPETLKFDTFEKIEKFVVDFEKKFVVRVQGKDKSVSDVYLFHEFPDLRLTDVSGQDHVYLEFDFASHIGDDEIPSFSQKLNIESASYIDFSNYEWYNERDVELVTIGLWGDDEWLQYTKTFADMVSSLPVEYILRTRFAFNLTTFLRDKKTGKRISNYVYYFCSQS